MDTLDSLLSEFGVVSARKSSNLVTTLKELSADRFTEETAVTCDKNSVGQDLLDLGFLTLFGNIPSVYDTWNVPFYLIPFNVWLLEHLYGITFDETRRSFGYRIRERCQKMFQDGQIQIMLGSQVRSVSGRCIDFLCRGRRDLGNNLACNDQPNDGYQFIDSDFFAPNDVRSH